MLSVIQKLGSSRFDGRFLTEDLMFLNINYKLTGQTLGESVFIAVQPKYNITHQPIWFILESEETSIWLTITTIIPNEKVNVYMLLLPYP